MTLFPYTTLFRSLLCLISNVSFTHLQDKISWRWDSKGKYTTQSLYSMLNYSGILTAHSLIWWSLPIPPKIKIFMWLLSSNKLLTKSRLARKGWLGDTHCHFCSAVETRNHLFLTCPFTQQIWFWLGKSQDSMHTWSNCNDILQFASTLPKTEQMGFLIMYSALCWTIWKYRNGICFNHSPLKTARNIILLIISLITYWTGHMSKKLKEATEAWLVDTVDAIPLQTLAPDADPVEMTPEVPRIAYVEEA